MICFPRTLSRAPLRPPPSADPSLVVRGKWAHGRTFTSLLADYIFLSVLSAYGLATNIAKAALAHAKFFGEPFEAPNVIRMTWK